MKKLFPILLCAIAMMASCTTQENTQVNEATTENEQSFMDIVKNRYLSKKL